MEQRSAPVRLSGEKPRTIARDISDSLGKLTPQAIDLEEAVLGASMLQKDAAPKALAILEPHHFYLDGHQRIFTAIKSLHDKSQPVDMRTVVNELRTTGSLEIAGNAFYIAELTSKVSSAANIEYHARILIDYWLKRECILLASQIYHDAYEDETDVHELMERLEKGLMALSSTTKSQSIVSAKDALYHMVTEIAARSEDKIGLTGVPCGYNSIDRITQGWQASDFIVLAGRPGMAKTASALAFAYNAAVDFGVPVGFASVEMATVQLMWRLTAMITGIPLKRIRSERFSPLDYQQLTDKTSKLADAPLYIVDSSSLSISELRTIARQLKQKYGIKLLIVDYLQLLKGEKETLKKGNREQEIASITRGLKSIAKELDIAVIALSQLSREVEKRGGWKIPQLSDLRESGSIENDADLIMFIWRPEYYKIPGDDSGTFTQGLTKFIIAKHRNGSLDDAYLTFISHLTAFKNCEHIYTHTAPPEGFNPLHKNEPAPSTDEAPF